MPNFIDATTQTYLGAFNPNTTNSVSIDVAIDQLGDFSFDPVGNLNNVSGNQKLIQDVMLFLLSPIGTSLTDETWGNAVLALMGTAATKPGQLEDLVLSSVQLLKQFKDRERQLRHTEASELISSVNGVNIVQSGSSSNDFQIEISLTTHQQNTFITRIPLNGTGN